MAWESTNDFLSRRQGRKEADKDRILGLFQQLSGMGLDVFKTLNNNKLARELPGITAEAQWGTRQQELQLGHLLDVDSMHVQAGIDTEMLNAKQKAELEQLDAQYKNDMSLLMQQQAGDEEIQALRQKHEADLQAKQNEWESGENATQRGWQSGENALDRAASLEEAKLRGQQDENAIRLSAKLKGTNPENITLWKDLLESAYQQGQLNGTVIVDELGQERVDPARVEDFRAILEAGLTGDDAGLDADLQRRIDAFINSLATPGTADASGSGGGAAGRPTPEEEAAMVTKLQTVLKDIDAKYSAAPLRNRDLIKDMLNVSTAIEQLNRDGEVDADVWGKFKALLERYAPSPEPNYVPALKSSGYQEGAKWVPGVGWVK